MNEAAIRDLLVGQLDCLEAGLELLKKEQYIPSEIGTKSFIDILARDENNNWVIIELKRSDAAARQAIHEVLKYAEAVKTHLGVRNDEIRIIIVSTIWNELLIPYSRFVSETALNIAGYNLDIGQPKSLSAEAVDPIKMNNGRALSPWHEVNLYTSQDSLQQGIESYRVANAKKGITDYIFVIMHSPDGHHERELEATRQGLINVQMQFRDQIDHDDIEQKLSKMQAHPYMLYFVPQLLTPDQCLAGIEQGEEGLSEINEVLEGMEEEEALCTLHEYLFAAPPATHNDYYEIGYPAKFKSRLLQDEGWKIIDIIKEGAFARNKLLEDDVIISEISGFTGSSGQSYKREISLANRAQVETARNEISDSLTGNAFWTASVLAHIDEAVKEFPDKEANITVFNPATALFTLYFAATRDEGITFVPSYFIEIPITENKTRAYFGQLQFLENKRTFKEVLDEYYDGEIGNLLMTSSWGCRESRDVEILRSIGLRYRSYMCDADGDDRAFFQWEENEWQVSDPIIPYDAITNFFDTEEVFSHHLISKIHRRMSGGFFDGSNYNKIIEENIDPETSDGPKYSESELGEKCNICECLFSEERYFVDGAVPGKAGWANMCVDCFTDFKAQIGWGYGQLYKKLESGGWQRVAGGPPDEEE